MKPTPRPAFLKVAASFTCKGTPFAFPLALSTGGHMTPSQPQYGSPNDIRDMQENAADTMQSAKQQLNEMLDGISERAREYGRFADEQVQQNPWTAVGVGFGVGIVMGALLMLAGRR
jgi:ElaB/YqjD/DUF883 family membrane-anchored ribosome-binding protein